MKARALNRIVCALAAIAVFAGVAAGRPDTARAQDNAAVAVNLKDGASIFRFAFKIARVNKEVVDQTNAAVAYASCDACQTIAVAIQVVLVFSDPDVVTPTNLALALNYECTTCETLASAYQWVLTTGGPVRFTPEGNRRIGEIRKAIRELLKAGGPIADVQAELDVLTDQIGEVIRTELVPKGKPGSRAGEEESADEGQGGGETGTEPTGETTTPETTETTETTPTGTTETTETAPG